MVDVIAAGMSRTGTFSLKRALESLGHGPCYHMDEFNRHPEHAPFWVSAEAASSGVETAGAVDLEWTAFLREYRAVADAPACHFWRAILAAFPEAKVILTVRDSREWYESFRATVYPVLSDPMHVPEPARVAVEAARRIVLDGVFGGNFADDRSAISAYEEHNRAVRREVDPESLLVYEVASGWQPLCEFLGVAVPETPFPRTNGRALFRARVGLG